MKKQLSHATVASALLAVGSIARASESADTGVTEMNASMGTVGMLIGGVAAMGVVLWVLIKMLNRGKK